MNQIQTHKCPRWDSCSANYCPINGGSFHLRGEATCYYMREVLKGVSADLFKGDGERLAYAAANEHIALWDELPSALKRDLTKAAKSPSRRM